MEDNFTFSQSDLISSSFTVFEDMRKNGDLIDLKITIHNRSFLAHRLVLAGVIPYFRTVLNNSVNEISFQEIDPDALEAVIVFAYCGKIKISSQNALPLLVASQLFQLAQLYEACLKFIQMRIDANNVFEGRLLAGNLQCLPLAAACDNFFLRNFDTVSMSNQFLQLPFQYLKAMVSRDDLNIRNEESLFEAVIKWVRTSPIERYHFLPELLVEVRLCRLPLEYLIERISSDELIQSSFPCKNLIEETKNYHLLSRRSSTLISTATWPRSAGSGLYAICDSQFGTSVELYDSEKNLWITVGIDKCCKTIDRVVGYNGKIYVFDKSYAEMKIDAFDVKTQKWEKLKSRDIISISSIESFEQVVLNRNKIYVFLSKRVLCFDPVLNKWPDLNYKIDCEKSGFASMGEYIYVTGGYTKCSSSKAAKRCDFSIEITREISPMLAGRYSHGCTGLNGKVYVCGGSGECLKSAEVYNPQTNQWVSISPMNYNPFPITLLPHNGKLYTFGSKHKELYDPKINEWRSDVIAALPWKSDCLAEHYAVIPKATDEKGFPESSLGLRNSAASSEASMGYESSSRTTGSRMSLLVDALHGVSASIENVSNAFSHK